MCIELCVLCFVALVQLPLLQHEFSSLCQSVPSLLRFSSHPPSPDLCRMQSEGASGVEVPLAFGPPLSLSPAQLWE